MGERLARCEPDVYGACACPYVCCNVAAFGSVVCVCLICSGLCGWPHLWPLGPGDV